MSESTSSTSRLSFPAFTFVEDIFTPDRSDEKQATPPPTHNELYQKIQATLTNLQDINSKFETSLSGLRKPELLQTQALQDKWIDLKNIQLRLNAELENLSKQTEDLKNKL